MEQVRELEQKVVNLIGSIINEKQARFRNRGYALDAKIESVTSGASYESEVYVFLRNGSEVAELYPVQLVLALDGEEPVFYIDDGNIAGLEKDIRAEIEKWEKKYLEIP